MLAGELRDVTGCSVVLLKEFQSRNLLDAKRKARGSGRPANFDAANAVVLLLLMYLRNIHVIVAHYGEGVRAFHKILRSIDSSQWNQKCIWLLPDFCELTELNSPPPKSKGGFCVGVRFLSQQLKSDELSEEDEDYQIICDLKSEARKADQDLSEGRS